MSDAFGNPMELGTFVIWASVSGYSPVYSVGRVEKLYPEHGESYRRQPPKVGVRPLSSTGFWGRRRGAGAIPESPREGTRLSVVRAENVVSLKGLVARNVDGADCLVAGDFLEEHGFPNIAAILRDK